MLVMKQKDATFTKINTRKTLNPENLGLLLFGLFVLLGLVLPDYRFQCFIAGIITLFFFALLRGLKRRKRKLINVNAAQKKSVAVESALFIMSASVQVTDNWNLDRAIKVKLPQGEYDVSLEVLCDGLQTEIEAILLTSKNESGVEFERQDLELAVDSGLVIIVDASFSSHNWDINAIKTIAMQMFRDKSNTRHRFIIDDTGRQRGIIAIPGSGDGRFPIVSEMNAVGKFQFRISFY